MTKLKAVTVGVALAVTSLAVSVAQADQSELSRGLDRLERIDRIVRGGLVAPLRGERRMRRLTNQLIQDLRSLKQTVRYESLNQRRRGRVQMAIQDIQSTIQVARQMKRVVNRRGMVPRLQRLVQRTRMEGRQAVMSVNRVALTRRGERMAARTIDDLRFTMQKIRRVVDNNTNRRPGRGGRGGRDL